MSSIKQVRWFVREEEGKVMEKVGGEQRRTGLQAKGSTCKGLRSSNNTRKYKEVKHRQVRAEGRDR